MLSVFHNLLRPPVSSYQKVADHCREAFTTVSVDAYHSYFESLRKKIIHQVTVLGYCVVQSKTF